MKENNYKKIESIIDNLINGNIYTPIKLEGVGEYLSTLKKLEELRLKLVLIEDNKNSSIKSNHTMIASIAHDMKTPLQLISGYKECLQDGINDKDYLKLIGENVDQLNNFILSLVDSSQEEINKVKLKMNVYESKEFFINIINKLSTIVDKKQDKLIVSKIPNVKIRLESENIERVIQNLISNSVKYSKENSVIKVRFYKNASWFIIKVSDNGNGISKEDLPHIFEKFYKEDKSRTDSNSNGLGLYIVKQIVDSHGGRIVVKSKKGKGTTFKVCLPINVDGLDRSFAALFDRLDVSSKIVLYFFTSWLLSFLYRLSRFIKSGKITTLIGSLLSIGLLPFVVFYDFVSIAVYKKITFLAD